MNCRAVGITVIGTVLSGFLVSCSLNPEVLGTERAASKANAKTESVNKNPSADNFQIIGRMKVDEFNDLATGEDTPRDGGQLVLQVRAEPDSVNAWTDNSLYSSYVTGLIYNSLLRQDPETFEWEGSLAERWTEEDVVVRNDGKELRGEASYAGPGESGDVLLRTPAGDTLRMASSEVQEVRKGVVFTFHLRRGIKFHDGHPLTAADVKFSFDTIKNEYVDAPALRTYYNDLKSCEMLDPYTIRMTYSKQYWMARSFAGGFEVLPEHIYNPDNLLETDPEAFGKRFNESEYNRKPIGSGPYQFERWDTGNQIILSRNREYWDVPRRGHLDRIIFRFITDDVAAITALKAGDVNFVPESTGEQFDQQDDPAFLRKFAKAQYFLGSFRYVGWNMRRPPFNDVKVRQAMAYGALDRQQFIDSVLHGHGIIVTGSQHYFGPAYDHSVLPYPFDSQKARQLLLEAGWYDRDGDGLRDKNGQPFRFEMLMPSGFEAYRRRAALMKENLRKLGIDMTVKELEWATFLENINDRKFDACSLGWGTPIESDPYQIWHSSQSENRGSNHVGFGTPETDQLIEQSRRTIDDDARRKLFSQLHHIQHEAQPYLFMYTEPSLGIYDKRYRGVKFYKVRPGWDLAEWYLAE
ncbi:MAG: hypothetical protein HYX73_08670 [Acidobacteria bacterium]|nr:hypothetical protein [Acidobacteriota bacterium]